MPGQSLECQHLALLVSKCEMSDSYIDNPQLPPMNPEIHELAKVPNMESSTGNFSSQLQDSPKDGL